MLAIASLVFSFIHFFWKDIAGLLASLGVYTEEPKREGTVKLHDQGREIAEQAGEIGFYIITILILVALTKFVPYHWFKKAHKIISLVFVVLVFHSIKLFGDAYWDSMVGTVFGVLMFISVIAAFYALFGRIGTGRRAKGKIVGLTLMMKWALLKRL